jgi:hypothetical protein
MWRAQPIFISSTFKDFQAERDHLRAHVFPALEERLHTRRRHLEWVDLRIGVAGAEAGSDEQRELQVLKVCLAEVRRCRPFFLVLLGDRYGWIPPAERIAAAAAEEDFRADFDGSVTELEIEFGSFTDSEVPPRTLFYFREPLPYALIDKKIAADYRNDDAAGASRLSALKRRIESALPERVRRYRVDWDNANGSVTGLEQWGRDVLEDIWNELADEAPERSASISRSLSVMSSTISSKIAPATLSAAMQYCSRSTRSRRPMRQCRGRRAWSAARARARARSSPNSRAVWTAQADWCWRMPQAPGRPRPRSMRCCGAGSRIWPLRWANQRRRWGRLHRRN